MKQLFMALSLFCVMSSNAQQRDISYTDGDQKLLGILSSPQKALDKKPGILILPAWMGIQEHSKQVAQKLADMGYYAFVADIYGVGNKPTDTKEAAERSGQFKNDVEKYRKRISLALEQLIKQGANADEIIVIGYCFGGTGALEAARANMPVKGVVSFHGGLKHSAQQTGTPIKPKILVLHGADDPYVPKEEVDNFITEMKQSKADWQLNMYANAVHAFTEPAAGNDNSKGAAYNEKADKRSWQAMLQFFSELF